jgi:lysophospholipase L1-like esterase
VIRRVVRALTFLVVGIVVVLAVEIGLALRREYLPTTPALEIRGTFGDVEAPPLTFVVLGDSTAAGVGAGSVDDSYPVRLARRVARERFFRVRLVGLGTSGARVRDVLVEQLPRALEEDPDVVVVAVGANDVTHATRLDAVADDTRALLRRLEESGAAVVVAGPPDMRSPVFLEPLRTIVGWRGNAVAARIEGVARAAGVPVVPLADGTREHFAADPDRYYSEDDFHPGPAGYGLWADVIYPYVEDAATDAASGRLFGNRRA